MISRSAEAREGRRKRLHHLGRRGRKRQRQSLQNAIELVEVMRQNSMGGMNDLNARSWAVQEERFSMRSGKGMKTAKKKINRRKRLGRSLSDDRWGKRAKFGRKGSGRNT